MIDADDQSSTTGCRHVAYGTWVTSHVPVCELAAGHVGNHRATTRTIYAAVPYAAIEREWTRHGGMVFQQMVAG